MSKNQRFMDVMENDIRNATLSDADKSKLARNLLTLKEEKINIMITGATGCGKSSTINALFNAENAKVGVGVDPETMDITKYEYDNLILWDTPGLGDGKEADNRHAKNIINKLHEKDDKGNLLIDLVLVLLDGSTRDLGTSYELINSVIVPNLGEDKENRILVALNQCDVAMKGRFWDNGKNAPEKTLEDFLNEKVNSVKRRIKEGTGINTEPIFYKAGFKEAGMPQEPPYNLAKLLFYIIKFTPKKKRLLLVENINNDKAMWKDNDNLIDYVVMIASDIRDGVATVLTDVASAVKDVAKTINSWMPWNW